MKYKFKEITNEWGAIDSIETALTGRFLLTTPELNKGSAFTEDERHRLGLQGKLPAHVEKLDEQVARYYRQYQLQPNDLARNEFLNNLRQHNNTVFYRLVVQHLDEMLPIVYTPTIGDAVKSYSYQFNTPRGLHFSYNDRESLDDMLNAISFPGVDVVILTDGEGVLGIGDWGIGGIDICVGKLMVYTLCGGVNPRRMMPIQIDVGTNNQSLLNDPMYLGWRHPRVTGNEYDMFIDKIVKAIQKKFPRVFLHWEDFGISNARRILKKYKNKICTFNDDVQGTGATALACVLSALKLTRQSLRQQRFVIFGAGTAGVGIADQILNALVAKGLPEEEARQCFWLIDRYGLLVEGHDEVRDFQRPYLRSQDDVALFESTEKMLELQAVVDVVQPTVLIGCSAVAGAFTESVVKSMASSVARPIILPLSNPTTRAEATPTDLFEWTAGKALVATGSPFDVVEYDGRTVRISQCNNAFIFPGLGLGVIASKAKRVTDGMLAAAAHALAECSPLENDPEGALLPMIKDSHAVSRRVALRVAQVAREEGVVFEQSDADLEEIIEAIFWEPEYVPYQYVDRLDID